jgi:hypothetical protein
MKFTVLLLSVLLSGNTCLSQFETKNAKIDSLIDIGKYEMVSGWMNREASANYKNKKWLEWAHNQVLIAKIYDIIGTTDSVKSVVKKIDNAIWKFKLKNERLNCDLFLLKSYILSLGDDLDNWKKYLDKSFALKKSFSSTRKVDLIPFYLQYMAYYSRYDEPLKQEYYAKKARKFWDFTKMKYQKINIIIISQELYLRKFIKQALASSSEELPIILIPRYSYSKIIYRNSTMLSIKKTSMYG